MDKKTIEIIKTEFIGSNFSGVIATEEQLQAITGCKWQCYDQCIDDGVDGDEAEDSYVMLAAFSNDNGDIVRIYYGDVTEEIGYVSISAD